MTATGTTARVLSHLSSDCWFPLACTMNENLVQFIPNLFGFVLGLIWTAMYPFKAAPVDSLRRQWRAQTSIAAAAMIMGAATVRARPHVSSSIAAAVGVLMCTYPLQSMGRAYADRNPGLMGSPAMNGAMFACTASWVVHASPLVEYDVFVLTANGAGALVQGCALLLRVVIARGGGGGTVGGGEYAELL